MTDQAVPDPPRPRGRRRPWRMLAAWVGLFVLAIAAVRILPITDPGHRLIEAAVDGLKVGRIGRLHVTGFSGDPWRDARAARVTLTDADGVWIEARDVRLKWRPAELLTRRIHIAEATAATVRILRAPRLAPAGPPGHPGPAVRLDRLSVRLVLDPAFAYRRGVYDLRGSLSTTRHGASRGALYASSVLHPGDFLSGFFQVGRDKRFQARLDAREAQGGALAGSLGLASDQPFLLAGQASGAPDEGRLSLTTQVGAAQPFAAAGAWDPLGGEVSGRVALAQSSLLSRYAAMVGPEAHFDIKVRPRQGGLRPFVLTAASANIGLEATGIGDPTRLRTAPAGVTLALRVADASRLTAFPVLGAAGFDGRLTGEAARWSLSGVARVADAGAGPYRLARASGPITLTAADGRLDLRVAATGEGGAGAGPLGVLLGARPKAAAQLDWLPGGRLLLRNVSVDGAGLQVRAAGDVGLLGDLSFKGTATLSDATVGGAVRGHVTAGWSAAQARARLPWSLRLDAQAADLALRDPTLNALVGAAPHLRLQGEVGRAGLVLQSASLDGARASLTGAGTLGPKGDLALGLDWRATGPVTVGPVEVAGAASGRATIGGTLATPRAEVTAALASVDLPGLPLREARLDLVWNDATGGGEGHVSVTAASAWGPAHAAAAYRLAPAGLDLTGLDIDAGGLRTTGALGLRGGHLASGDLALSVGPGAFLAAGRASGTARLAVGPGGPVLAVAANGRDLAPPGGGPTLAAFALNAHGALKRLPYTATATGPDWSASGGGLVTGDRADRAVTFAGAGRFRRMALRTLEPAVFHLGDAGLDGRLKLALGEGRADVALSAGREDVTAKASLVGASLSAFDPDLVGRVDGTLTAEGRGPALTGLLTAHIAGAGERGMKAADALAGDLTARLNPRVLAVNLAVGDAEGLRATLDLALPARASAAPLAFALVRDEPLTGHFAANGELRPLWDLAVGGDRAFSGRLTASGAIAGTLADPRVNGTADLDDARFQDAATGLKLNGMSLRARLGDNAIDVDRFAASDGAAGSATGSGRISLVRDGTSSFRLDLKRFRLIDNDLAVAAASGQATVSRSADGRVKLAGALTIDSARIAPTTPVPSGVVPMAVTEIHQTVRANTPPPAGPRPDTPVALDVKLTAPGGILLKGRGLNVELSLDARVTGTTSAPGLDGVARVVRGDYDFAGRRFQIDDTGVVHLAADPDRIRLDLTATRDDPTLTAVIRIQGTAAKPTLTFTSTPVLPQDEILSQVLFGASASQLTPLQAAQLASAVSGLAGGGGFDVIGGLRNFAHLDRLAFGGAAGAGATVSGGKYITDRVYVELTGGSREGPTAQVEWRVRKHVAIVSKVGGQAQSQLSVRWRKDY